MLAPEAKTPWYSPGRAGSASSKLSSQEAAACMISPTLYTATDASTSTAAPTGARAPAAKIPAAASANRMPAWNCARSAVSTPSMRCDTGTCPATTTSVLTISPAEISHPARPGSCSVHIGTPISTSR